MTGEEKEEKKLDCSWFGDYHVGDAHTFSVEAYLDLVLIILFIIPRTLKLTRWKIQLYDLN